MEIIINDTNILIDLVNTGLLALCPGLNIEMRTIDFVMRELKIESQLRLVEEQIAMGNLKLETMNAKDVQGTFALYMQYHGSTNLSRADCAVMHYAESRKCRMLTSDKTLRTCSEKRGIKVGGLLYLTDLMVEEGLMSRKDMVSYLQAYLATNERAPKKLIEERIAKYNDYVE